MNKLKQTPLPIPHAHVVERLDSTNKSNAPTRVHMYTHTRAYINVYAYIYTDIHIYIYIHTHMHLYIHIHAHTYAYACIHMHTYAQIKNLGNNASTCQAISWTHIYIHIHMHAYTHIYAYTHMCTICSECVRRCVRWCTNTPV